MPSTSTRGVWLSISSILQIVAEETGAETIDEIIDCRENVLLRAPPRRRGR